MISCPSGFVVNLDVEPAISEHPRQPMTQDYGDSVIGRDEVFQDAAWKALLSDEKTYEDLTSSLAGFSRMNPLHFVTGSASPREHAWMLRAVRQRQPTPSGPSVRWIWGVYFGPLTTNLRSVAQGGAVAAVFDGAIAFCVSTECAPIVTTELSVKYKSPTPVGKLLFMETTVVSTVTNERGKTDITTEGVLRDGDRTCAVCCAVFRVVPLSNSASDLKRAPPDDTSDPRRRANL